MDENSTEESCYGTSLRQVYFRSVDIVLFLGSRDTSLFPCFSPYFPALYLGGIEEKNRKRLEQLADRTAPALQARWSAGLRVRRPRRLHFETHQALRELEKSLKTLERHHQIHSRRLRSPRMFIDDPKPALDNLDQRLKRLEEILVKG